MLKESIEGLGDIRAIYAEKIQLLRDEAYASLDGTSRSQKRKIKRKLRNETNELRVEMRRLLNE